MGVLKRGDQLGLVFLLIKLDIRYTPCVPGQNQKPAWFKSELRYVRQP